MTKPIEGHLTEEQIKKIEDIPAFQDNTLGNVHMLSFAGDEAILYEGGCDGPSISTPKELLRVTDEGELAFTFEEGNEYITWDLTPLIATRL